MRRAFTTATLLTLGLLLVRGLPAQGLPETLKRMLKEARRLRVYDKGNGNFGFQLSGQARPSPTVQSLSLLHTVVQDPRPSEASGQRKAWIWTVGQGNGWYGGQEGVEGRPEVRLLLEAGESGSWMVDFQLPKEKVAGGEVATLELGPYRPVYVIADAKLELVGVDGGPKANGGYEGLLGSSGRLGVMRVQEGGDAAVPRRLLEARLHPPADLRVDAHYRVTLESAVARCLVRDLAPHPGPKLTLEVHGEAEVLAVRQLPGLRPVLYRREGEHLVLNPGPGPGPRYFLVELAGVGSGAYAEEFALPIVGATSERKQVPGWIAVDRVHPGKEAAMGQEVGTAVESSRVDSWLHEAFGDSGYRLWEAHGLRPKMSISRPSIPEMERVAEVWAVTTLVRTPDARVDQGKPVRYGWSEVTDVTFELPPASTWVELGLFLPPGSRDPELFRGGKPLPVVLQTPSNPEDPSRVELAPRVLLEPKGKVLLRYRRDRVPETDAGLNLSLPQPDKELGNLTWRLDAPAEYLLGAPVVVQEPESAPAGATTTGAPDPTASAGPSTGFGGSFQSPEVPDAAAPEGRASGPRAILERTSMPGGERLEVTLAVARKDDVMVGHTILFLAGLMLGSWLAWGRRVNDASVALPVVGALLVLVGFQYSSGGAIHTPWGRAVLGGAVFGLFVRALWWAASEFATAKSQARRKGPRGGGPQGPGGTPAQESTPAPANATSPAGPAAKGAAPTQPPASGEAGGEAEAEPPKAAPKADEAVTVVPTGDGDPEEPASS
jgi:hypothetical protein